MLCTRCGKRPAVVFVSNNNSKDAPTAGYCLTCAKELGIKPVEDLISKMGISDEDLENVQDQMNTLMNSMGDGDMSQLMEQLGADNLAEQMGDFAKDGDGRSVALISYNSNGEAQYTINTEHKADSLSVYKGTVAILDGNVVYGYNQNGDLLYSTNSGTGSKKIVLASDYTAYILSVNQIRFIDLDNVSSDDTAQTSKQE